MLDSLMIVPRWPKRAKRAPRAAQERSKSNPVVSCWELRGAPTCAQGRTAALEGDQGSKIVTLRMGGVVGGVFRHSPLEACSAIPLWRRAPPVPSGGVALPGVVVHVQKKISEEDF
eukprot:3787865-Pyramimonas_sp.AAC.1